MSAARPHEPHPRDGREIHCGRHTVTGATRPVVHDYSAVVLHLEGTVWVAQDGVWEALPGDVRLVPAGTPHAHRDADGEVLGAGFCPACLRADGLGELLVPFDAVRSGRLPLLRPPPEVAAKLRSILELLEAECRTAATGSARARRALLELVLIEVCRLGEAERVPASGGLVAEALAWIEAHALEPSITTASVAAALRRSTTHLTTAVRQQTGRTVGQWIVALRMAEARRRLRDTDERVDVIGERVGYDDASHFSRVFRRVHGASPTAWRRDELTSANPSVPSPGCG